MELLSILLLLLLLFVLLWAAPVSGFLPRHRRPPRRILLSTRHLCLPHAHAHHEDHEHHEGPSTAAAAAIDFTHQSHYHFMGLALEEARAAAAAGEIPVGAVLVSPEGRVLSVGRNRVEASGDASAHAEMECLRAAAASRPRHEGHWRMLDCTLYVTLEPCLMCLGAIQSFRVRHVVYGARNRLLGAVESFLPVLEHPHPFHQVEALGGVRAEECGAVMREFFAARRLRGWQVQGKGKEGQEEVEERREAVVGAAFAKPSVNSSM